MNYKEKIYQYYRTAFKGEASIETIFNGSQKLLPIINSWVKDQPKHGHIVDLGCGAGELLMSFQQLGFTNLSGCDLSAEQVAICHLNFPLVVEADLFSYLESQADNSIRIITMFDVLEHLTRQQAFDLMPVIHRKLQDDGLFIAHSPNGISPFVGHVYWGDITHEWCLTPQSAATLCRVNGFTNFEAAEHIGASASLAGVIRVVAWNATRGIFRLFNAIETGSAGGYVWTRNFAFKAVKVS